MLRNPRRCFVLGGAVCLLAATIPSPRDGSISGSTACDEIERRGRAARRKNEGKGHGIREGVFACVWAPDGNFPKDFSWAVIEDAQAPRVQIEDAADAVKVTGRKRDSACEEGSAVDRFSGCGWECRRGR